MTGTRRLGDRRFFPLRDRRAGFSFLEVVMVLVLLGILAFVVINRRNRNTAAVIEADALKAALRFAQSRAMADIYTWGIQFSSDGYSLVTNNTNVTPLLPGQGGATRSMPDGVTIKVGKLSQNPIYFDWRGQPVTEPITSIGEASTPATDAQTITLTQDSDVTVTVTPYTGFVP